MEGDGLALMSGDGEIGEILRVEARTLRRRQGLRSDQRERAGEQGRQAAHERRRRSLPGGTSPRCHAEPIAAFVIRFRPSCRATAVLDPDGQPEGLIRLRP